MATYIIYMHRMCSYYFVLLGRSSPIVALATGSITAQLDDLGFNRVTQGRS